MSVEHYELFDSSGYTAKVYRVPNTNQVCKSFLPKCASTQFPAEVEAYKRFTARGHPPTILKYYGVDESVPHGILLEIALNRNLSRYLWHHQDDVPTAELLYRWARQAASGLAFAHSCGVLHSDIHCVNFLLDEDLDLKVADFAGASIDGGKSWSCYRTTHWLPEAHDRWEITTASEIFALGSALHYMVRGHDVYPELDYEDDEDEIVRRLREGEFPDTSGFRALGQVTTKCWTLQYASMEEVVEAIEAEQRLRILEYTKPADRPLLKISQTTAKASIGER